MKTKRLVAALAAVASFAAIGAFGAAASCPEGSIPAFAAETEREQIVSFEKVTLTEHGMRGSVAYEIVMKDGHAEVTFYRFRYADGKEQKVPENRAVCEEGRVLRLLNDCGMLSWDGFVGAHPKGVLDGIMFELAATVNKDRKIYAHGSENFPQHYRDFTKGLREILDGQ